MNTNNITDNMISCCSFEPNDYISLCQFCKEKPVKKQLELYLTFPTNNHNIWVYLCDECHKNNCPLSCSNQRNIDEYSEKINKRRDEMSLFLNTNSFINKNDFKDNEYHIHDNGGRPFIVIIDGKDKNISIYLSVWKENEDERYLECDKQLLTYTNIIGYWFGYDTSMYQFHSNSILIKVSKQEYILIGAEIYVFYIPIDDEIIDFVSGVGNSDMPYPIAFGEKNVYFLLDKEYLSKDQIVFEKTIPGKALELYRYFYDRDKPGYIRGKPQKMDFNNLVERRW